MFLHNQFNSTMGIIKGPHPTHQGTELKEECCNLWLAVVIEVWNAVKMELWLSELSIDHRIYLEAVAIPRAIGSRKPSLSSVACTKFAPTRPVKTTTAAVRDELAPVNGGKFSEIEELCTNKQFISF